MHLLPFAGEVTGKGAKYQKILANSSTFEAS